MLIKMIIVYFVTMWLVVIFWAILQISARRDD